MVGGYNNNIVFTVNYLKLRNFSNIGGVLFDEAATNMITANNAEGAPATLGLAEWAIENCVLKNKENNLNNSVVLGDTTGLITDDVVITRVPYISCDVPATTDGNGIKTVYAEGLAPTLKANGYSGRQTLSWMMINSDQYTDDESEYVPVVTSFADVDGDTCATKYPWGGREFYILLYCDGILSDNVHIIFPELDVDFSVSAEYNVEKDFVAFIDRTDAAEYSVKLVPDFGGTLPDNEYAESYTYSVLNSYMSSSCVQSELTVSADNGTVYFPYDFLEPNAQMENAAPGNYLIKAYANTNFGNSISSSIISVDTEVLASGLTFDYNAGYFYNGAYHVTDGEIPRLNVEYVSSNATVFEGEVSVISTPSEGQPLCAEVYDMTVVPTGETGTCEIGIYVDGELYGDPLKVIAPITDVEITGVTYPEYGVPISTSGISVPDGAIYEITDAAWYKDGTTRVANGTMPEVGKTYTIRVTVDPKDNEEFPSYYYSTIRPELPEPSISTASPRL